MLEPRPGLTTSSTNVRTRRRISSSSGDSVKSIAMAVNVPERLAPG